MAAIQYSIFKVLEQYFSIFIQKQKNNWNISIYYKYILRLLDIRCSYKKADILLFLILLYNKGTIFGPLDIICKLADRLKLIDDIILEIRLFGQKKIEWQYKTAAMQYTNNNTSYYH